MSNPITSILSRRKFRFTKILRRASMGATSTDRSRRSGRSARVRAKSFVRSMFAAELYPTPSQMPRAAALCRTAALRGDCFVWPTILPGGHLDIVEEVTRLVRVVVARELPGDDPAGRSLG